MAPMSQLLKLSAKLYDTIWQISHNAVKDPSHLVGDTLYKRRTEFSIHYENF
jgi:hypothetical protein